VEVLEDELLDAMSTLFHVLNVVVVQHLLASDPRHMNTILLTCTLQKKEFFNASIQVKTACQHIHLSTT
jgi:hypothetical protein